MGQTNKPYVSLTATLGSQRLAATLACAEAAPQNRLARAFCQHPETEIVELLITGCLHNFHSGRGGTPRLLGSLNGEAL